MTTISLEAETRTVYGKGASRRLRRLEGKVPAIIYGGSKKPELINLLQNKVNKALENEAIYSSILDLFVDGKSEKVLIKDIQRHPYKPIVLHMDFQRISAKDAITRMVPLHFINSDNSPGHKAGGVINHHMMQIEITCKAKDLPEFIEVDLIDLQLDEVIHLFDIKLPKNVSLTIDSTDTAHNLPVVSSHISKSALSEEALEAKEEAELSLVKGEPEEASDGQGNLDESAEENSEE